MAIFFEHADFVGDPLVVLDTTGVVLGSGTFIDGNNLFAARSTLDAVLIFLDALGASLEVLSVFSAFPGPLRRLPPLGHVKTLRGVVSSLRGSASSLRPAVDARGVTVELGDVVRTPGGLFGIGEVDFGRVLSSVLMVGLPNAVGMKLVYEGGIFGSDISELARVPGGTVIATTTNFGGFFNYDANGTFTGTTWPTNTSPALDESNGMVIISGGGPWCNDLIDRIEFIRPAG